MITVLIPKACLTEAGRIYYHWPHKLLIIAGEPQKTIEFILKFYLYLIYFNMRDIGFS